MMRDSELSVSFILAVIFFLFFILILIKDQIDRRDNDKNPPLA